MNAPSDRTRLDQELLLATADIDALAALIAQLASARVADQARLDRATERWIEAKIRAAELREELERTDHGA